MCAYVVPWVFSRRARFDFVMAAAGQAATAHPKATLTTRFLLVLNVTIRLYLTFFMIVPDCDETFNYWEALNLLVRGFGKQTWEYSPEYAIRSYAYLIQYYIISLPLSMAEPFFSFPPYVYFYAIRLVALNGFSMMGEWKLHSSISQSLGPQCANWFLFLSTISPGMSHGAVALLPSSLALGCVAFATSYVLSYISTPQMLSALIAVAFFLYGGIYGWPFALVLAVPFGLYIVVLNLSNPRNLVKFTLKALFIIGLMTSAITIVDSFFYKKLLLVPLNIVMYNVFGGEGEGPEIFGVEPFVYYVHNLLLNFNASLPLSIAGCFLSVFGLRFKQRAKVLVSCTFPVAIWFTIFASQPHKEERFLYPIYPLIVMAASVFLSWFVTNSASVVAWVSNERLSKVYKQLFIVGFGAAVATVSILRTVNLVENYSAPITIFRQVSSLPQEAAAGNVCIGREWYHFPASFFLKDSQRLRFVKSGFDGLLPGDFKETSVFEASSTIPEGMNNRNVFAPDKVVTFDQCAFYVDNSGPIDEEAGEISVYKNGVTEAIDGWEILGCENIIDPAGKSSGIGRLLWIPIPFRRWIPYDVDYMRLCLSRRQRWSF